MIKIMMTSRFPITKQCLCFHNTIDKMKYLTTGQMSYCRKGCKRYVLQSKAPISNLGKANIRLN